jgi:hypothetical protein
VTPPAGTHSLPPQQPPSGALGGLSVGVASHSSHSAPASPGANRVEYDRLKLALPSTPVGKDRYVISMSRVSCHLMSMDLLMM